MYSRTPLLSRVKAGFKAAAPALACLTPGQPSPTSPESSLVATRKARRATCLDTRERGKDAHETGAWKRDSSYVSRHRLQRYVSSAAWGLPPATASISSCY